MSPDLALLYDEYNDGDGNTHFYGDYAKSKVVTRHLSLVCKLSDTEKTVLQSDLKRFEDVITHHRIFSYASVCRDKDFGVQHDTVLKKIPFWVNPRYKMPNASSLISLLKENKSLNLAAYLHDHGINQLKGVGNVFTIDGAPVITRELCVFRLRDKRSEKPKLNIEDLLAKKLPISEAETCAIIEYYKNRFVDDVKLFGAKREKKLAK